MSETGAVLITGCSTGIGRATAEHLAAKGHTVYATARKPESIADLEGKGIKTLALDVTDETSMATAVKAVEDAEGAVGVLVNNAGYSQSGAVESVKLDDVRAQFETNVFGLIRMSQLVLPGMRAKGGGRILNIGSMGGTLTFPGGGIYHATKYAVEAHQRRDALRGQGLRRGRGADPARADHLRLRHGGGGRAQHRHDRRRSLRRVQPGGGIETAGAYEGPLSRFGGPPAAVAKVVEKAITSGRPRTRYKVTASARVVMRQRKLLSDRMWDRFVGTQFPQPH